MRFRILLYPGVEIQKRWAQEVSFHGLERPRHFKIRRQFTYCLIQQRGTVEVGVVSQRLEDSYETRY